MPARSFPSEKILLIGAVFVAGLCSIVYELLISTTSAYFLGDSVKQFSLTIGIYLFAMGIGALLSQFILQRELSWFIAVEMLLGLCGGLVVPILYASFKPLSPGQYQYLVLLLTFGIGCLTGLEIPLLASVMKRFYPLKTNLANVLGFDYIGALIATLLFPFILLPFFGLLVSGAITGAVNILLGLGIYTYFSDRISPYMARWFKVAGVGLLLFFSWLLWSSNDLLRHWEESNYAHPVVYSEQTPYQQLTLTKNQDELRLYLNRVIQFSSRDEYRYHEALALIPAAAAKPVQKILILGGGEGLLARELLKLPEAPELHIVDLDARVFDLAREHGQLRQMNQAALDNPRVSTHVADAAVFLEQDTNYYDLIIADLPDPGHESLARLYSNWFYQRVRTRLTSTGIFATQATSPYHTHSAFWCIVATLEASGFTAVTPYHLNVPSFGEWGFVMASPAPFQAQNFRTDVPTKYLDNNLLPTLFYFSRDLQRPEQIDINRLDRPALLDYFLADWSRWQREETRQ
ncbi:MAG: polyamine aminopropyltransferase [Bacteroidota bacterium]